jgi:hypothetical protein
MLKLLKIGIILRRQSITQNLHNEPENRLSSDKIIPIRLQLVSREVIIASSAGPKIDIRSILGDCAAKRGDRIRRHSICLAFTHYTGAS